jgi:hypothetical protein
MTDVTQASDTYADLGGGTTPDAPDSPTAPVCACDGSGWAGTVVIDGRDVLRACAACKPHLAGRVPTLAQRHTRALPRRRRLALVR